MSPRAWGRLRRWDSAWRWPTPDKQVIVCNGDGCMLMNLGSLVTITNQAASNYTLIIFDNGVYEITGGQPTPAPFGECAVGRPSGPGPGRRIPAGFRLRGLDEWRESARDVIDAPGPTFVHLAIAPVPGAVGPRSPGPAPARAQDFADAMQA
ncbi:MAG: hypothetical protein Ct9H300mP1_26800 [Planctomycetaceae bacterium]|nr:MAG: hypothetical protein Ct9H300mP1_26800 [Planctomycetaceae bacterium]